MIDFRYHLVSIVAIFLALGLGLVLGATYLSDPVLSGIKKTNRGLSDENNKLRDGQLEHERLAKANNQVVQATSPEVLSRRLKGESVVFVEAPGVSGGIRSGLDKMVRDAGARVSGTVSIQGKYLEDGQITTLDELAQRLAGESSPSSQGTTYEQAAGVLASALVTSKQSEAGQETPSGGKILAGFKDLSFLTYVKPKAGPGPAARATLAIVIAPSAPSKGKGADVDNKAMLSITAALDAKSRGTIMVGTPAAASDGGLIQVLRDNELKDKVSSVDFAQMAAGQLSSVLALEAGVEGKTGQYGVGQGASSAVPSPIPSIGRR